MGVDEGLWVSGRRGRRGGQAAWPWGASSPPAAPTPPSVRRRVDRTAGGRLRTHARTLRGWPRPAPPPAPPSRAVRAAAPKRWAGENGGPPGGALVGPAPFTPVSPVLSGRRRSLLATRDQRWGAPRRALSRVVGGGQPWPCGPQAWARLLPEQRHRLACLWLLGAEVTEVAPWLGRQRAHRRPVPPVWEAAAFCLLTAHDDADGAPQYVKGCASPWTSRSRSSPQQNRL